MTDRIGLIVGSAFTKRRFGSGRAEFFETPFGPPSSPLMHMRVGARDIVCIARHGIERRILPHQVNYRANLWCLRHAKVEVCVGLNVVGGIADAMLPGELAVPEQLIDYTWGREGTFGLLDGQPVYADMAAPFDAELSAKLVLAISDSGFVAHRGTYGVTQGPRLETAAEIDRMDRDGCTMVGMTAMPEAALARELAIPFAVCAASVNYAAGRAPGGEALHEQFETYLGLATERLGIVIDRFVERV